MSAESQWPRAADEPKIDARTMNSLNTWGETLDTTPQQSEVTGSATEALLRPAPQQAQKKSNPLTGMLPTAQYRLRVRRDRGTEDPAWVGDYAADRISQAGSVEPFLGREVAPRLAQQGVTGDITFIVSAVDPNGRECTTPPPSRITVSAATAGAGAPMLPAVAQVAPAVAASVVAQTNELAELIAATRRTQAQLEERLQAATPQAAPQNSEMDALRQMVGSIASSVKDLGARLEESERSRSRRRSYDEDDSLDGISGFNGVAPVAHAAAATPQSPQLDMLGIVRELAAMSKQFSPPQPPPQPQQGLGEMLTLMAQAKSVFAPQNVNIDVSPLEEQISELRERLGEKTTKKDQLLEMAETIEGMKKVFNLVGGERSAPQPTGFSAALGNFLNQVVANPAPLADAMAKVFEGVSQMQAAKRGEAPRPVPQPRPTAPPPVVPSKLRDATTAVLFAENPEAATAAMHAWVVQLQQEPQGAAIGNRVIGFLNARKPAELSIYLRQVFSHLGFTETATTTRVSTLVGWVFSHLEAVQAAKKAKEEEAAGEGEGEGAADLTVRVGGTSEGEGGEGEEEGEEGEDSDDSDDSDEDEDEDTDDADSDEETDDDSDDDSDGEEDDDEGAEDDADDESDESAGARAERGAKASGAPTNAAVTVGTRGAKVGAVKAGAKVKVAAKAKGANGASGVTLPSPTAPERAPKAPAQEQA